MTKAIDDEAFRQLVREHAPYIWRVLRSLGIAEADLPDACQETFVVLHRKLPSFEGRSALRTWVYGVTTRVASDYRSKAYRRRERPSDQLPEQAVEGAQIGRLERDQAWQLVDALLAELDDDRRQVFVLFEIEQLPMQDVANALGCPLSTAYARLASARAAVQRSLALRRERERTI